MELYQEEVVVALAAAETVLPLSMVQDLCLERRFAK
jgi:hypothetical protein